MCGIAGVFAYRIGSPAVDPAALLRIRDSMVKRGPDGAGMWIADDGRVGLAHRRLAIIDLSDSGAQPMFTEDGALCITFNGEIYNYRALRDELEAKGVRFRSTSDTEVLLHLYAERGAEMVHALRGMYAFALWDSRKRGLLLARDPFGIKPLYYADDGATLRLASQVKALLKGGSIDTDPEAAGHVGFFLWGCVPEPYTLYKGIRALPAGSTLWLDESGRREEKRFFSVNAEIARAAETRLTLSADEMRERLRAVVIDSVRHHMIADVPVGVFLSAGIDSTTLAAIAQETACEPLHTLTLGFREFEGTANDEAALAARIAEHYGTLHETRWVTREDFQREYHNLLEAMDQPSTDGVNSYFVSKAAADAGLKVAISGLGGDELFGGYPSFRQIPPLVDALGFMRRLPLLGRAFQALSAPLLRLFTSPKYAGLLQYGPTYGGAYLLRRSLFIPPELSGVLDEQLLKAGLEELCTLPRLESSVEGVSDPRMKVTALETAWYMRNQLLRDVDWASMAHSLEVRVPLVDIELFRAVVPLFGSANAPDKRALSSVPAKALPHEIVNRAKTGFVIPVRDWLAASEEARAVPRGLRSWARHVYERGVLTGA